MFVRGEDFKKVLLSDKKGKTSIWKRGFLELPEGNHQIIIEGHTEANTETGIIMDDIYVQTCQFFSNVLLF